MMIKSPNKTRNRATDANFSKNWDRIFGRKVDESPPELHEIIGTRDEIISKLATLDPIKTYQIIIKNS